jgi:hypothetical protein
MFADLEIIINATEPTAGDNVTLRYGNTTAFGAFRLSAVAEQVAQLNAALDSGPPPPELCQSVGSALFHALLAGDLLRLYAQATAPGKQVRLRLMSQSPELLAVPWEYVYDGGPVALDRERSLVRSLAVPGRKPVAVDEMLRVLVMISDPADLTRLDVAAEWANLTTATATAAIDLRRVDPTYEALQGALRQYQPHIFHFVGHGLFDDKTQQGLLYFQRADGNAAPYPAAQVATLLSGCETLRLALLNACQGATPGNRSAFAGVAQQLIQQGLPAVIAMQAPILDTDALAFSQEFYRALADGYHLEAAVGEGRKRIAEHSTAWGVPALYFQGSEPFALPVWTNAQKAERLWQQLPTRHEPAQQQSWLTQILALDPHHRDAQNRLTRLNREAEAEPIYAAAVTYMAQEQWRDAHRALEQVTQLTPNFRDTRSRLAEVLGKLPAPLPPVPATQIAQMEAYKPILNALLEGRLTFFLGGDVSRIGRPAGDAWVEGLYPPGASDAARVLARNLPAELQGDHSLLQVSQYTLLLDGEYALYDRLHALYAGEYQPTMLHHLLAEIPQRLAAKGYPKLPKARYVLFSTALDDLLERAFVAAGQPYHLFAYRPRFVDDNGVTQVECFLHAPPADPTSLAGRDLSEVLEPNIYTAHDRDNHPILVKLCGRGVTTEPDSVAVTEDHYMNYISAEKSLAVLPTTLLNQIKRHSFLFFGHSLQPWHLRLLWQRLRIPGSDRLPKWAIVPERTLLEEKFWRSQHIDPIVAQPEGVVAYVTEWLERLEDSRTVRQ